MKGWVELKMAKKDINSNDVISQGTLHEILLDIKYRLDHLEDIEADNRALMVKLIKQSNSVVKFLAELALDVETYDDLKFPTSESSKIDSEKNIVLRDLIEKFMEKTKEMKEFEEELKKNKDKITPGEMGES